jgi:16S rRNA (adenine1518-N6/adenine1519-N6)-dimethyltransferase
VVAFEVDERLRPLLEEVMGPSDLDLRFVDVTAIDLGEELGPGPWKLVANLPYNVGTSLVLDVLLGVPSVESLTVMVQAEVADRLTASPGSRTYGVPSLVVAYTAEVRTRFRVPPQVFVPVPRVDSAVVRLDRRQPPAGYDVALGLARTAFAQRRKMLRSSLGLDPAVFDRAEIDPTSRPEQLAAADFVRLAETVADA